MLDLYEMVHDLTLIPGTDGNYYIMHYSRIEEFYEWMEADPDYEYLPDWSERLEVFLFEQWKENNH